MQKDSSGCGTVGRVVSSQVQIQSYSILIVYHFFLRQSYRKENLFNVLEWFQFDVLKEILKKGESHFFHNNCVHFAESGTPNNYSRLHFGS